MVALPAAMDAEQLKEAEQGVVKRETEVEMIKQVACDLLAKVCAADAAPASGALPEQSARRACCCDACALCFRRSGLWML